MKELIASDNSWVVDGLFPNNEGSDADNFSIEKQFITYYKIAQSATPEELTKLKRIYETTAVLYPDGAQTRVVKTFAELLKNPSGYPKIEEFLESLPAIIELEKLLTGKRNEDTILQGLKLWYYERDLKPKDKTIFQQLKLWHYTRSMKPFAALPEKEFFEQVKKWDLTVKLDDKLDDTSIQGHFVGYYVLAQQHANNVEFMKELRDRQVADADENRDDPSLKLLGEVLKNPSAYPTIQSLQETVTELETLRYNPFDLIPKEEFFTKVKRYDSSKELKLSTELNKSTDATIFLGSHPIDGTNIVDYYALATGPNLQEEQLVKLKEIQTAAVKMDSRNQYAQFLGKLLEKTDAFADIASLKGSVLGIANVQEQQQQRDNQYPGLTTWELAKLWYLKRPFRAFQRCSEILHVALLWIRFAGTIIATIFGVLIDNLVIYFAHSVTYLKESLQPAKATMLHFITRDLKLGESDFFDKLKIQFKQLVKTEEKQLQFERPFQEDKESKRIQKDLENLEEYIEQAPKNEYSPRGGKESLTNWQSTFLKPLIESQHKELQQKEQQLLEAAAHHLREKSSENVLLEVNAPDPTMQTLQKLFLNGSLEAFREKTTLTDEEIQTLFNDLAIYFSQKSAINLLETINKNLTDYLRCRDADEAKILFETFARSLDQHRQYPVIAQNRAKLLFEAVQGIILRKLQVEKIGLMFETFLNKGQKTLFEMPTGTGKTKGITPPSNLETSDGEHLTINIFPRTLTVTNTLDNAGTLEKAGRNADSTVFHRATFMSKETLDYLHRKLLADITNNSPLDGYSETFRAMELHLLSLLMDNKEKPLSKDDLESAELLRKILQLLRTKGFANIDEAKDNLNPFDRLIYTRKQRSQLPDYEIDVIEEIFMALLENQGMAEGMLYNRLPEISRKQYLEKIAPSTAESMVNRLRIGQDKNKTDEANAAEKKLFIDYVLGKTNLYGKDDKPTKKWLDAHEKRESIALVRGLLIVILPDVMKGYVNQHYGFSKKHRDKEKDAKDFAIPYLSANTPKENDLSPSEFQNQHEAAGKTLVALFHEGLSEEYLQKMLDKLIDSYTEDALSGIQDENNDSYKTIRKVFMVEENEFLNVREISKNFIGEHYDKCRYNPDTIFHYFKYITAPHISLYKQTFVSTSFDLLKQFLSSTSMTATPQEAGAHGKDTVFVPTPGSKGFIPYHFFAKGKDILKIDAAEYSSLVGSVGKLLFKSTTKRNALIDIAGLFRGHSNREVVDSLFTQLEESQSDIEAIAYFDEQKEEFVVVGKDSKTEMSYLKDFKGDLSKVLFYFDKARTVGSDTKWHSTAEALALIGPHTTQSEMGQGIGRARQLQYGQTVTFAVPSDFYDELYESIDVDAIGKRREFLYRHLSLQEDDLEGRGNLLSIKQQINADIRNIVLEKVCSAESLDDAQAIFSADSNEMVTTANFSPSALYGSTIADADVEGDLNRFLERAKERVKNLHCLGFFEKRRVAKELESYKVLWEKDGTERLTLPVKTISTEEEINGECDVLVEVEQEVEQEIELQTQVQRERLKTRPLSRWGDDADLFTPGWEKIRSVGAPLLEKLAIYRLWLRFERRFPKTAIVLEIGTMIGISVGLTFVAWYVALAVGAILAAWALYKIGSMIYDLISTKATPVLFRAQDIARLEFGDAANKLFDEDLLVTNNYSNQQPASSSFAPQPAFTYEQKPGYQILFLVDEEPPAVDAGVISDTDQEPKLAPKKFRKTQAVLVDQNDATFLRKIFAKDLDKEIPTGLLSRQRHTVLYDLQTNTIIAQGKNALTLRELQELPAFFSYTAQAKLYDRQFNSLQDKEFQVLQDKTALVSAATMMVLVNKILEAKPDTKKKFRGTSFGRYLREQLQGIAHDVTQNLATGRD